MSSRAILRLACAELGWRDEPLSNDKGQIFWSVGDAEVAARLERLKARQTLSRIPGMAQICQKRPFALLMRRMQGQDPETFRFWPQTWVFPDDAAPKASAMSRGPLIWKPSEGAQGDGIVILSSAVDMRRRLEAAAGCESVMQRYLPRPMLLGGMKFDIRLYVLITSLSPLRVFVCREGLVRVCTTSYEEPTARNKHKLNGHLTNYSVNKYEVEFQHDDDPSAGDRGSKRSLSAVLAHLEEHGHDSASLQSSMHHIALHTCTAIASALRDEQPGMPACCFWPPQQQSPGVYNAPPAGGREGPAGGEVGLSQCFQLLGFDMMFCEAADGRHQAHLLEVNALPSLAIDSVFPIVGPHACLPHPPPATAPWAGSYHEAMQQMPYKGCRQCLCRDHHRPHLHAPSAVDLTAKRAAVSGALQIMRRQMLSSSLDEDELADGTAFVSVSVSA